MEELTILQDLLLILAIGAGVALVLRRFNVPSISGFIVAGILAGPKSLGFISDSHEVEQMAEIGVMLLLFGIGLELSLEKVRRLWKLILLGGSLQVGFTIATAALIASILGMPWNQGIFLGCLVAVSSTAIVLRGLEYRGEIDAPHGRFALGILIFQDLCVVPMMLAIPILARGFAGGWDPLWALLKTAAVIVGVLAASRIVVPRILHHVAMTRQRDLFVLVVVLICIGTAWVVAHVGVSLALGAFLAGLVVAGSEYRHQAMADLIPLKEVLASLFFISVGMMLDPVAFFHDPWPTLGLLSVIVVGKFVVIVLVGFGLKLSFRVALLTGMSLAQAGEFLFVLLRAAKGTTLVGEGLDSHLMAAAIISMLVTPALMFLSPHLVAGLSKIGRVGQLLGVRPVEEIKGASSLENHVIIAGYGIAGEELATALREQSVPYVIVDLNAETVRLLSMQGEPAYFGDVANTEVLERVGIHHAREFVVVISDHAAARRALDAAQTLAPDLPVLVRVAYVADVQTLLEQGADNVIASEFESAVEIVSQVLERCGTAHQEVQTYVEQMHSRCRAKQG